MKIAILARRLNTKGGTQRQAVELGLELKRLGHRVTFYTFVYDPKNCYGDKLEGMKVVSLPEEKKSFFSSLMKFFGPFYSMTRENSLAKKLASLIDEDTDILNPHAEVVYRVVRYFKKNGGKARSVWMMNDMPTKFPSFLRLKEVRPEITLSFFKKIFYLLFDAIEKKRFISCLDGIAVLDNRDKTWTERFFGKEAKTIRSGVDVSDFKYKERTKCGKPVKILSSGVFSPHRRFEDLIKAVKILDGLDVSAELKIIGDKKMDSDYARFLEKRINFLELDKKISLLGVVSESELRKLYEEADVFVLPSHIHSWGLSVFEAMASGIPTIVSKTAGASEVLEDGKNVLLVPPKSPEKIASLVKRLAADDELYAALSSNGRNFVEEKISWRKYGESMLDFFKKVSSDSRG